MHALRYSQRGDNRQANSVEAQMRFPYSESEKGSSHPVTQRNDTNTSWRETGFGPATIRHPFQVAPARSTFTAVRPSTYSTPKSSLPATLGTSMESRIGEGTPIGDIQDVPGPRRRQRPQSLSFFYPRSNPTPVSFSRHDSREEPSFFAGLLIPLVLYIPVPSLLSLIYLITGHAVLKSSANPVSTIRIVPLVSSLKSGLVGGAILSLPLTIILYLLFFPSDPGDSNVSSPLDFFEDDESQHNPFTSVFSAFSHIRTRWRSALAYVAQALIIVFVGTASGPLGVTCLSDGSEGRFLSTGQAAAAGAIGGLVLSPGIVGLSVLALVISRMRWQAGAEEVISVGAVHTHRNAAAPDAPVPASNS